MTQSDNVLAESLAREVAMDRGLAPDFAGAAKAVRDTLAEHGLGLEDSGASAANLADSSGLSVDNRVTPAQLDRVLLAAAGGQSGGSEDSVGSGDADGPGVAATLRPLLDSMPVGGVSGTLTGRYGDSGGAGWVRAKTGNLSGVSALVGTIMTADGRPLTFAFLSNGSEVDAARTALDQLAASLRNAKSGAPATN